MQFRIICLSIYQNTANNITRSESLGFGTFPSSGILENTTFRKLDLFPSSGEGGGEDTYSVGPYRKRYLNHPLFCIDVKPVSHLLENCQE
jgi:hypothetical protein